MQYPDLKGFIGHFKESVLYPKDNKERNRECEVEMEYFKSFGQKGVMIFAC